jgi:hypothetical protein
VFIPYLLSHWPENKRVELRYSDAQSVPIIMTRRRVKRNKIPMLPDFSSVLIPATTMCRPSSVKTGKDYATTSSLTQATAEAEEAGEE